MTDREDEEPEASTTRHDKLFFEALRAEMSKLMDEKLEAFSRKSQPTHSGTEREQRTTHQNHQRTTRAQPMRGTEPIHNVEADAYYEDDSGESQHSHRSRSGGSQHSHRSRRHGRREEAQLNNPPSGLKLKIPPFYGKNDPDAYLEWEKKIELVFDCQFYTEENKVKYAATEFYDYALSWWDQLVTTRRRNRELPIRSWRRMKLLLRKRFVPTHHHRELHSRLRNLNQGTKSVEEYYQELETLMLRVDIQEDQEATMSRFLGGLHRDIADQLELQHYEEIEDLLHKAILIEKQLKRRSMRSGYGSSKQNYPRVDKVVPQKDSKPYAKPKAVEIDLKSKEKAAGRTRDIKCFKCHGIGHYASACSNARVMIIKATGEIESEDEPKEESSDEYVEEAPQGSLLVAMRSLSVIPKTDEQEQRTNLFHSRCVVNDKLCSLIIDGGSCTNVASEDMVQRLALKESPHPRPYKLQWLSEDGELSVDRQVMVPLAIGKYEDEVLCDILPMEASHILLGRPWQSDRRVVHDGYTNRHSFVHKGRKIILAPMAPRDVYFDQLSMRKKKQEPVQALEDAITHTKGSISSTLMMIFKENPSELTKIEPAVPSSILPLLQAFKDVFPMENPPGLPPIRGIEHQIDFIPGAVLPNKPTITDLLKHGVYLHQEQEIKSPYNVEHTKNKIVEQLTLLKTSLESKCTLPSIQSDFVPKILTSFEPEQPSSMISFAGKLQRHFLVDFELQRPSNLEPEHMFMPFPCDYPRKHCKEFDLVKTGPNLFVVISANDEKRFGLEQVKEFHVSSSVFDKLVLSFETLTPESFFNKKEFLFNDGHAYRLSMETSVSNNVFDMFRDKTKYALFRTWSELSYLLKNLMIKPCKLNVNAYVLELKHSNKILIILGNEIMFDHLERLFAYFYHTFDVFSLVFVNENERQVKDSRKKIIQALSNQVDYEPSQHIRFWNWKYSRKTTLSRGFRHHLKCTKTIQGWEEDQRFNPPDLYQNQQQNFGLFFQIKEDPPDSISEPKTRLCKLRGKFSIQSEFISSNLLSFYADGADLRTNPSQQGGNDIRMAEQLEPEQGELGELGPEEMEQAMEIPSGPVTRAKAKKLQEAVGTMLKQAESNLSLLANPTTLVVIQAS